MEISKDKVVWWMIPKDFEVIRTDRNYVECIRPDGLRIFLDQGVDDVSYKLNWIRIHGTPEEVIRVVGWVRGCQIALSYAKRYCSELVPMLTQDIEQALAHVKLIA